MYNEQIYGDRLVVVTRAADDARRVLGDAATPADVVALIAILLRQWLPFDVPGLEPTRPRRRWRATATHEVGTSGCDE